MIDGFLKFLEFGLYHIVSFSSYDHILFLVVLTVPYAFKDWTRLLLLVSFFTLGHTLSLLLGVYDIINLKVNVVEWLIPFTIIIMALYNIFTAGKASKKSNPIIIVCLGGGCRRPRTVTAPRPARRKWRWMPAVDGISLDYEPRADQAQPSG